MIKKVIFIFLITVLICCDCSQTESLAFWKEPLTGMEFVLIPKGSFLMGSHLRDDTSSSGIPHKVTLSKDYWLARTEVTQHQWQIIMGDDEFHPKKPSPFRNTNPHYPIVSISYFDIQKFLKILNKKSKEITFRLPTEAEWEYACRAGTKTPFSTGFHISDAQANFNAEIASDYSILGNNIGHPLPIASYPPNSWRLHDMHGNVWEWVADWYAPYSSEHTFDPQGPQVGKKKVIRGGSWYFGANNATSSARRTHEPELWGFSIGFRIVCERQMID